MRTGVPGPTIRPKLIYLARRHPGLSAEAFRASWRRHGDLGMSLPRWRNVWRYTQCDRLAIPGPPASIYDGVATITFRSDAARLAHAADPDGRMTQGDEAATFAAPVRQSAVLTHEVALAAGAPSPIKVFVAVRRAPGLSHSSFSAGWRGRVGARLGVIRAADPAAGLIQNDPVDADNPLDLDCVDEITTTRPEPVVAAISAFLAGETSLVAGDVLIIPTREVVLHGADPVD